MKITTKEYPTAHKKANDVAENSRGNLYGGISTPYGVVSVWATCSDYPRRAQWAEFIFGWHGHTFVRTVSGRAYTRRGLITVARRFAREIAGPPPIVGIGGRSQLCINCRQLPSLGPGRMCQACEAEAKDGGIG